MLQHYPFRRGIDAEHDCWGSKLPPMPHKPYLSSRQLYKRRAILSMTPDQSVENSCDTVPSPCQSTGTYEVRLEITRIVEVRHGAIGGTQKVIGRVVQAQTELLGEEVLALIYDPMYVAIDDLRVESIRTLNLVTTHANVLGSEEGQSRRMLSPNTILPSGELLSRDGEAQVTQLAEPMQPLDGTNTNSCVSSSLAKDPPSSFSPMILKNSPESLSHVMSVQFLVKPQDNVVDRSNRASMSETAVSEKVTNEQPTIPRPAVYERAPWMENMRHKVLARLPPQQVDLALLWRLIT